jgi:hypothetical protein
MAGARLKQPAGRGFEGEGWWGMCAFFDKPKLAILKPPFFLGAGQSFMTYILDFKQVFHFLP